MITTTAQQILDGAYAKSMQNMPGVISTESTELLQLVIRSMRGLYAYGARVNPTFFAKRSSQVSGDGIVTPLSLAKGAGAATTFVTNGAASAYRIGGIAVAFPGSAVQAFSAAHKIDINLWGCVLLQISQAGVMTTKVVNATQSYTSAALALAALPAADVGKFAVGYWLIQAGAQSWDALTDGLDNGAAYCTSAIGVSYAATTTGWDRPSDAESIWRLEADLGTLPSTTPGTEIVVVPFDDRAAESGKPAVFEFGQKFFGAGNTLDPTSGTLEFFYSKRPADPANLSATLDELWVEQFNELLILEVAIYLALKDGNRDGEVTAFRSERDAWLQRYVAFLEHGTANLRRRYGHRRYINTQTMVPLTSLLAGGSAAGK